MADYSNAILEIVESEKFSNELYKVSIDIVINRLEVGENEISKQELLHFVQKLFAKTTFEHEEAVKKEIETNQSNYCLLNVQIIEAEGLKAKDVDGTSDPYCIVSVVPTSQLVDLSDGQLFSTKKTRVVESLLDPKWNQNFEFVISRDEIGKSYFQLQVWDYDGVNARQKKAKGIKGWTKHIQDMVLLKRDDHEDDFMGYRSVRLGKIPEDGLEKWLKCKGTTFQNVSGRVKVILSLTPIKNKEQPQSNYPTDLLYTGLLQKILQDSFKEHAMNSKNSGQNIRWKCTLSSPGENLLREFLQQYHLPQPYLTYATWEPYAGHHLKNFPGIDAQVLQDIMSSLQVQEDQADGTFRFTGTMFSDSVRTFIQEECSRIACHREVFPNKKENHFSNLENLLSILKSLEDKEFQRKLFTVCPGTEYDVRLSVLYALENGSTGFYSTLHSELIGKSKPKNGAKNKNEDICEGIEIEGMVSLTETLLKDLTQRQALYGDVFQRYFDIDYVTSVGTVIHKHLAYATNDVMSKMNKIIFRHSGCSKCDDLIDKLSGMFRLHKSLHQFLSLTNCCINDHADREECPSPDYMENAMKFGVTETDAPVAITHQNHRQWFLPVVMKWVQLCKEENLKILEEAIRLDDSVKRVDQYVKHSTSAVDTVTCLSATVQRWNSWEWPDPFDSYAISRVLASDISHAVERYADLLYEKLKSVGFFDDVGQFDVTEQSCVAINNLQFVRSFLLKLPNKMMFQLIADTVDKSSEGLRGETALLKLSIEVEKANERMMNKIKMVTKEVGLKMKPDISKHLTSFAEGVIQAKIETKSEAYGKPEFLSTLREVADKHSKPVMEYLASNLKILMDFMDMENFDTILSMLWEATVECLSEVVLEGYMQSGPAFYYQCRHLLDELLIFFNEDGDGLSENTMKKCDDYRKLDSELKLRAASTGELIKMFYLQMYHKQETAGSSSCYGILNVFAWYDLRNDTLHIDVISAADLTPLDVNGLSDPFVQLRLAPPMHFDDQPTFQTKVEKKSLQPLWNEEFSFQVDQKKMEEDGTVVIFAVLDYDLFANNELEGEATIPLKVVLEKARAVTNGAKIDKQFQLKLVRMKQRKFLSKLTCRHQNACECNDNSNSHDNDDSDSSSDEMEGMEFEVLPSVSPLQLIRARSTSDKEAADFIKSRRKFKKGKKFRKSSN